MSETQYYFYALGDREIWFETGATGEVKVVGVNKIDLPSDEDSSFGLSVDYPMLYIYKILSILLPYPSSELYEAKYNREVDKVKLEQNKHKSSGTVYLMEI